MYEYFIGQLLGQLHNMKQNCSSLALLNKESFNKCYTSRSQYCLDCYKLKQIVRKRWCWKSFIWKWYEILYNKKSEDILQYVNRLHYMRLVLTGSRCAYQFYSDFTQFNNQHSLIEGSVLCYIDLKQYM